MKEYRVFIVPVMSIEKDAKDSLFFDKAEERGTTYSLKGFCNAFNNGAIEIQNDYIRITNKY